MYIYMYVYVYIFVHILLYIYIHIYNIQFHRGFIYTYMSILKSCHTLLMSYHCLAAHFGSKLNYTDSNSYQLNITNSII